MPDQPSRLPNGQRDQHGLSGTVEYRAWTNMIWRCRLGRHYLDRGITVCPEWEHDFLAFLAHVGPKPSSELTLDRIDNDRGYEPGNVRWATVSEQNRNKRNPNPPLGSRLLTYAGETLTLDEWATRTGLKRGTIRNRIVKFRWSVEDALTVRPDGCFPYRRLEVTTREVNKR
jgi:hypothetical protein